MDVSRDDEERVKAFLIEQGFQPKRFSKKEQRSGHKTPDLRVFQSGEFRFFCEVKSIERDTRLGGARYDPTFNKLTVDIHTAAKQFDAVNPDLTHPNVLTFVNHNEMRGIRDLVGVVTGQFLAAEGKVYPIYLKYSQGRIRVEKTRIHLFVWFNEFESTAPRFCFTESHESHHRSLCAWFGIDPEVIKIIGT